MNQHQVVVSLSHWTGKIRERFGLLTAQDITSNGRREVLRGGRQQRYRIDKEEAEESDGFIRATARRAQKTRMLETRAVVAVFDELRHAAGAAGCLKVAGIDLELLTIVSNDYHSEDRRGSPRSFIVGGLGTMGDEFFRGISKEDIVRCERAIQANRVLFLAHGTQEQVDQVRAILTTNREAEVLIRAGTTAANFGSGRLAVAD